MPARLFIDGEAGTTGLGIRERLLGLEGVELASLPPEQRKNAAARRDVMASVDLAVLCLPDDAAREAVALADGLGDAAPRILDASTAHRVAPGWVYGFAELAPGQEAAIAAARRVANPGCYPTGAIALLRPLVDAGLLPPDYPVSVNAVSGYSGGGKAMIAAHEAQAGPAFELYGLGLDHKHVAELQAYARLALPPIFVPSVGHFRQGMLVSVPLHFDLLRNPTDGGMLYEAVADYYAGKRLVHVLPAELPPRIEPEQLNGTDLLELGVFANNLRRQAVLVARLDNLGKGASGAAVQNIALMLGLPVPASLGRRSMLELPGPVWALDDLVPRIASSAFIAPNAVVVADVRIGDESSVWFGCLLRGDDQPIRIGRRTNVQDGTIVHVNSANMPTLIGDDVTIGHAAIIHACTIEDEGFVGMGATVLDGAVIERGGMLAAGSLLTPGKRIRAGELWQGAPARLARVMSPEERAEFARIAPHYVALAARFRSGLRPV